MSRILLQCLLAVTVLCSGASTACLHLEQDSPEEEAAPASEQVEQAQVDGETSVEAADYDGEIVVHVTGNGRSISGARVVVVQDHIIEGEAVTGPDGLARVRGRSGAHEIEVQAVGFAPSLQQALRPKGQSRLTVELSLNPGHTLQGVVRAARSRKPIPGARVECPHPFGGDEPLATTITDARGAFVVQHLSEGPHRLWVEREGYEKEYADPSVPAAQPVEILLEEQAQLAGQVLDSQGQPVADAEVVASYYGPYTTRGSSGADGRFTLPVRKGTYHLTARRGDQAGAHSASITVQEGEQIQGVVIRLGASGTLQGQVVARTTGKGVPRALLSIQDDASRTSTQVTANEDGHFSSENLPPGKYNLHVSASGYARQHLGGVVIEPTGTRLVRVELTRLGAVEGMVRDTNGAPVPGGHVMMLLESGKNALAYDESGIALEAIGRPVDAQGHYRFPDLAGRVRLRAAPPGRPFSEEKLIDVPEGGTVKLDLVVAPAPPLGTVVGTVRRPGGGPPGASVRISASPGGSPHPFKIDPATGSFELRLPVGRHVLKALEEGSAWGPEQTVDVEEGRTATVELSLRESLVTPGILLTPDGRPAVKASVIATLNEGFNNPTDDRGRFVLRSGPQTAGQETHAWFSLGGMTAAERIKLGSQEVRVQLRPPAVLKGRLTDGGAPVEGFRLLIEEANPRGPPYFVFSKIQREFPQDHFVVEDLPAFTVRLVARTFDGRVGKATVSLEPGREHAVDIPLGKVGWIRGRLVDGGGGAFYPNRYVFVELRQKDERSTYSDSAGRFEILGLEPGKHVLTIGPGEGKGVLLEKTFELQAGQALDLGDLPVPARPPTPGSR